MKVKIQTTYNCDYCNKLYLRKGAAETHEIRCKKNPENLRPCFGCVHLKMVTENLNQGLNYYGVSEREVNILRCTKREHYLHTPLNEHKGNAYDMGGENLPMPKSCDDFKGETTFDLKPFSFEENGLSVSDEEIPF